MLGFFVFFLYTVTMTIILAFIACAIGIGLSLYLFSKKITHTRLACPRAHPCDTVTHSRFSKVFGIPNELLGAGYFFIVALLLLIPVSGTALAWTSYLLFLTLILGGLYSLYLLGIQAFVIRAWCAWCIGIALTNLVLIVSLFSTMPTELFVPLLKAHRIGWVVVHNIGFILGVGAATITDVFFFRFLKDHAVSQEEKETMDTLTSVIWGGLAILVVSGFALTVPESARLFASSKFLIKVVIVGVIIINGVLLNMFVAPYLRRLSFEGTLPARRFRRFAFALGGISIVSWYSAFLLGSIRSISITFPIALGVYSALLVAVIVGSSLAERIITKQYQQS